MRGKTLSSEKAKIAVEARQQGKDYKLLGADLVEVGDGDLWDDSRADGALQHLSQMKNKLLRHGKRLDVNSFDKDASVILHRELDLPPDLIAHDGFWRWLAVEKFSEIVEARAHGESARLRNFGIDATVTANTIAILWFRADMVYDAQSSDPYRLASRPAHTDFWESGIIRHRYAWSRNLARSLVRFQYRDDSSAQAFLHSTDQNGIRELYKRLRRLHSTISFEYLSGEEVWAILEEKSTDLKRAFPIDSSSRHS